MSFAGFLLFSVLIMVVATATGRYIARIEVVPSSMPIIENICLPAMVFLGLAISYRMGIFPRFDGLVKRLPEVSQAIVRLLMSLLELIAFGMVAVYGWEGALLGMSQGLGFIAGVLMVKVPIWPIMFTVPIGAGLLSFEALVKVINHIYWLGWERRLARGKPQELTATTGV
ncbi:TRAP transporter small permease [Chloroflexota bacterium]